MAYTESQISEVKKKIVEQIALGKSLKSIIKENEEMPCRQTVYLWLNENGTEYDKEFSDNYARAREESADIDAEKVEEIARKVIKGKIKPDAGRVAIDAIKWIAGVKKPKKYGNKVDVTSGGEKLQTPIFSSNGLDES